MTSHFQYGGHDVRPSLAAAYAAASAGCLVAWRARDITGSLYTLQFLIHSTLIRTCFIIVARERASVCECTVD